MRFILACTLLAVATAGCSSPTYSCAAPDGSACSDYIAGYSLVQAQMACSTITGYTFSSTAACPLANRVGRCTLTDTAAGTTATVRVSTYSPADTSAQAMAECPPADMPASGVMYEFAPD